MAVKSGYFRSRLHVDLSAGRAESIPLADEFLERFIGGRGFGAKIVWDALAAHGFSIDPLGPENTLAIAGGPLTGMYLPSSGKCSFVTISPATGVYGDSSMGGSFGIELRQAGVDVLDITGRAPRDVVPVRRRREGLDHPAARNSPGRPAWRPRASSRNAWAPTRCTSPPSAWAARSWCASRA